MDYTIKRAMTEQELDDALAFAREIFGEHVVLGKRDEWLDRMERNSDLLLYAELSGKVGYIGSLLIQSEKHGINEMLSLNTRYEVRYTNVYNGKINQVCLALQESDRELQREYENALPGLVGTFGSCSAMQPECNIQMMFWKNI